MRHLAVPSTILAGLLLASSPARAQDNARQRAEQAVSDAETHADAGRHALAAERYLDAYELMREAGMNTAPLVLWNAGDQLSQVPGRESEAIETIRRFLSESTPLADDAAQVRDWRSNALARLDELEARPRRPEPTTTDGTDPLPRTRHISPIGPILLGVGGATLVAGAIVGGFMLAENDDLVARCPDGTCPTDARTQAEEVQRLGLATDVLLIGGALIAVAGLVLTFVLFEDSEAETHRASLRTQCGLDGCSVTAAGSF